ncbi:MAG: hypothetical protein GY947_23075 [Rhodobacteraceae bacterium]|nr:hypothetical protein [Paracoccaceae bacterium]
MAVSLPIFARAEDLSEALRLWKFTYQSEIAAYGAQYMSQELLLKAGDQLETAAGQTMVTNSQMVICIEASNHLARYYRESAKPKPDQERAKIRAEYEQARAGCMRLLGANPDEYSLGWPD